MSTPGRHICVVKQLTENNAGFIVAPIRLGLYPDSHCANKFHLQPDIKLTKANGSEGGNGSGLYSASVF